MNSNNPEVLSLISQFQPMSKKMNELKEHMLVCDKDEFDKTNDEIEILYNQMSEISEKLLFDFDIWIGFKDGKAMTFDEKFPWYKELINRGENVY